MSRTALAVVLAAFMVAPGYQSVDPDDGDYAGVVVGVVTDAETHSPVVRAEVFFTALDIGSITRSDGNYAGLATGIKYAYLLISPLLGGWFIGYWIDRGGDGNDGQVWGSIIGFFAGLAVVLVSVNKDQG